MTMSPRQVDSRFLPATDPTPPKDAGTTGDIIRPPKVDEGVSDEEDPVFEALYDLTDERLSVLFSSFDTDADGRIDYESLKRGLSEWQDQAGITTSAL